VRFDAGKLQVLGDPVQIVEGVLRASRDAGGGGDAQFGFSNNGSMVYIAGMEVNPRDRVLALVDRNGVRTPLNIPPGLWSQPRVSSDGTRLAVDRDDGKNRDIWIYDFNDAGPIHQMTFEGNNQAPLWLDDQHIVFTSDREGDQRLFRQRFDGGPADRLAKSEQGIRPSSDSWSRDSKVLIFTNRIITGLAGYRDNAGISALYIGTDQEPKRIIKQHASNSSLSPDGRWLAYVGTEDIPKLHLYVGCFRHQMLLSR
jgi:Tol biopolymer transport system component